MKKIWSLILTLLIPTSAMALPVGNPLDASLLSNGVFMEGKCPSACDPNLSWCDAWSFRLGYYGDFVFDRHVEVDTIENESTIHRFAINTNATYWAFNVYDRADLFGTLGTSHIRLNGFAKEFASSNPNRSFTLETETDFSWSIGLRGTIWQCGCLGFGAEAQYFYARPRINYIQAENGTPFYASSGSPVKYKEWQIGVGAAYEYAIASCGTSLVPYAAVKWSHALIRNGDFRFVDPNALANFIVENLKNSRYFGYVIGITFVGGDMMSITVEGRFIDERALHVNTQFRF